MGSKSGKNGHAVLQAVLAEDYALHAPVAEPETGMRCPYMGCPRPGHLAPDGETPCRYHGQHHGLEPELAAKPRRPQR